MDTYASDNEYGRRVYMVIREAILKEHHTSQNYKVVYLIWLSISEIPVFLFIK